MGVFGLIFAGYMLLASQNPLSYYSVFCGHIIDPILVTLEKKWFLQSQLSHFLIMHLPYKAF